MNPSTRTLQARFEVDNRDGKLVPGMLLRLQVAGPTASRLVLPSEAVMRTGTRVVAVVRKDNGGFEPRELKLGMDLGEQLEVVDEAEHGRPVGARDLESQHAAVVARAEQARGDGVAGVIGQARIVRPFDAGMAHKSWPSEYESGRVRYGHRRGEHGRCNRLPS